MREGLFISVCALVEGPWFGRGGSQDWSLVLGRKLAGGSVVETRPQRVELHVGTCQNDIEIQGGR